jgi:hypothetical protein
VSCLLGGLYQIIIDPPAYPLEQFFRQFRQILRQQFVLRRRLFRRWRFNEQLVSGSEM